MSTSENPKVKMHRVSRRDKETGCNCSENTVSMRVYDCKNELSGYKYCLFGRTKEREVFLLGTFNYALHRHSYQLKGH